MRSESPGGLDVGVRQLRGGLERAAYVVAVILRPLGVEAGVRFEDLAAESSPPPFAVRNAEVEISPVRELRGRFLDTGPNERLAMSDFIVPSE